MAIDAGTAFKVIGWTGQAFFFARFFLQWLASERAKRVVVPALFWQMSIAGSICRLAYSLFEAEIVFVADPVINLFIYVRNLALLRRGGGIEGRALIPLVLGIASFGVLVFAAGLELADPLPWLLIGAAGQLCWLARFPLQWWISERLRRAVLPTSFFGVSFAGSILLLAYACWKADPIFIAGYALGPLLYGRSLVLSVRTARQAPAGEAAAS